MLVTSGQLLGAYAAAPSRLPIMQTHIILKEVKTPRCLLVLTTLLQAVMMSLHAVAELVAT